VEAGQNGACPRCGWVAPMPLQGLARTRPANRRRTRLALGAGLLCAIATLAAALIQRGLG
jgi:hypothetical protein